jgi:uncharacterized protein
MTAQHIINSIEFARKSLEIHDIIPVFEMTRVQDMLFSQEDVLSWRLVGLVDDNNKPMLNLQVNGTVNLICGRCLESFVFDLNIDSLFVVLADESLLPSEQDDIEDEVDYLVADPRMQVSQLIEDEVLLALPYAPKHDVKVCGVKDKVIEVGKPNPFKVLQGLKVDKS